MSPLRYDGLRCRVSPCFFPFWLLLRVSSDFPEKWAFGLHLTRSIIIARFVLIQQLPLTYFCHRRAPLLNPRLASITLLHTPSIFRQSRTEFNIIPSSLSFFLGVILTENKRSPISVEYVFLLFWSYPSHVSGNYLEYHMTFDTVHGKIAQVKSRQNPSTVQPRK